MSRLWPIALFGAASLGCQAVLVPDELDSTTVSDSEDTDSSSDGSGDGSDGGLEQSQCLMRATEEACDGPTTNGETCIWRDVHQVDVQDDACLIGQPVGYCVPQSDLEGCDSFVGCRADAAHSVWFRIEGGQFFVTKRSHAECGTPQGFSVCSYGSPNLDDRCSCACEL